MMTVHGYTHRPIMIFAPVPNFLVIVHIDDGPNRFLGA